MKNLNKKFILALNEQAEFYELPQTKNDLCLDRIESITQIGPFLDAWFSCLKNFLASYPNSNLVFSVQDPLGRMPLAGPGFESWWSRAAKMMRKIFVNGFLGSLQSFGYGVGGPGTWESFLNFLCSSDFKDLLNEITRKLNEVSTWLFELLSSDAFFIGSFGQLLGTAMFYALELAGGIPPGLAEKALKDLFRDIVLSNGGILNNICNAFRSYQRLYDLLGITGEERETELKNIFDRIYGAGSVILESAGDVINVIGSFISSVYQFMQNNQQQITMTLMIGLAVAALAAAVLAGGAAAAAAAAILAIAALIGISIEGWTQESLTEYLQSQVV
jgi:hypothetical protein